MVIFLGVFNAMIAHGVLLEARLGDQAKTMVHLLTMPKTATVSLCWAFDAWLNLPTNSTQRSHFPGAIGNGHTEIDKESLQHALSRMSRTCNVDSCWLVSTARRYEDLLPSLIAYTEVTTHPERLAETLDYDTQTLHNFFQEQKLGFEKRFTSYFHKAVAVLKENGFPNASYEDLFNAPYDHSGYRHVTVRGPKGSLLNWLILDFDFVASWETILGKFFPGIRLVAQEHVLEDMEASLDTLKARLKQIPCDCVQGMDWTSLFYQ